MIANRLFGLLTQSPRARARFGLAVGPLGYPAGRSFRAEWTAKLEAGSVPRDLMQNRVVFAKLAHSIAVFTEIVKGDKGHGNVAQVITERRSSQLGEHFLLADIRRDQIKVAGTFGQ